MNWLIFAILAPVLIGLSYIVDKFVLGKKIKNIYTYGAFVGLLGLLSGVLVFLFTRQPFEPIPGLLAFLAGLIYGLSYLLYFKAVSISDISVVVTLLFVYPIFTTFFAFIFLGEKLEPIKYLAIILMVLGAVLISLEKDRDIASRPSGKWKIQKALWLMLGVAIIMGIFSTIEKKCLETLSYWNVYFLTWVGAAIILIIPLFFRNIRRDSMVSLKFIYLIAYQQILAFGGLLAYFIAASLKEVSIVAAMDALRPTVVFIFVLLISLFIPKLLKEVLTKEVLIRKLVAIFLTIIGAILIVV